MTAWAETWAPTPREKLTSDALAGLESSWDLVVATAFSFFILVPESFSLAAAGNSISTQLGQPGPGGSIVPCSGPSWEVNSCLPVQPTAPLRACISLLCFGELMTDSFLWQLLPPRNRAAKCLQLRKDTLLKLGSVCHSVLVCLSTKDAVDRD